jgi:predicted ester cyclase
MSEELKTKLRRAIEEGWNKGNLDAWDEVYAADYVHNRPPLAVFRSLEDEKQSVAATLSAYSESHITIHEMVMEGDITMWRWTWQARHTGQSPDLPIPPTGKEVTLVGCNVSRWANGKVVEEWEYSDYLGFLMQLGVIPPLG